MKKWFGPIALRWQQLQARERRLAIWCLLVVGAAILISIDDWQRAEHRRLQQALPAAEARLATMQQLADEFYGAAAQGRSGQLAPASVEQITASVRARGLALEVVPTGAGQMLLKGRVPFDDWIDWLASAVAQGWRVEQATIQRPVPGAAAGSAAVQVEATLRAVGA